MASRTSIYRLLGFGFRRCPIPGDVEGCIAGGGAGTTLVEPIGWADRLRILWSGRIAVDMVHQMELVPRRFVTSARFSVPEPGWRGLETMTTGTKNAER